MGRPMTDRLWDVLFDAIERAINQDGMSADEKGRSIRAAAVARGYEGELDEFVAQVTDSGD